MEFKRILFLLVAFLCPWFSVAQKSNSDKIFPYESQEFFEARKSMIMIQGAGNSSNAMVFDIKGKKTVVASVYYLLGNSAFNLIDCNKNKIVPTAVYFSAEHEVMLIEIGEDSAVPAMKLIENWADIPQNVNIIVGDRTGNKLLNFNDKTFTVKMKVKDIHDGNPVLLRGSDKALGLFVKHYNRKRLFFDNQDSQSQNNEISCFRLDNINKGELQAFDRKKFVTDADKYKELTGFCNAAFRLNKELDRIIPKSQNEEFKHFSALFSGDCYELFGPSEEWNDCADIFNAYKKAQADKIEKTNVSSIEKTEERSGFYVPGYPNRGRKKVLHFDVADENKTVELTALSMKDILKRMKNSLLYLKNKYRECGYNYRFIAEESEKCFVLLDSFINNIDTYNGRLDKVLQPSP